MDQKLAEQGAAGTGGDWVVVGAPPGGALALDVRHLDGEPEVLTISDLARRFGLRDPLSRPESWRWVDDKNETVTIEALGSLALENTVTGKRVPLAEAPRLLGCEVGSAEVSTIDDERPISTLIAQPAPLGAHSPGTPTHYTSKKGGPYPPGKKQQWCVRNLERYGAHKEGRDWVVSVPKYETAVAAQDAKRCAATASQSKPASNLHEIVARGLAERATTRELRRTKGGEPNA